MTVAPLDELGATTSLTNTNRAHVLADARYIQIYSKSQPEVGRVFTVDTFRGRTWICGLIARCGDVYESQIIAHACNRLSPEGVASLSAVLQLADVVDERLDSVYSLIAPIFAAERERLARR